MTPFGCLHLDCFFLGFSANPLAVNILSYASASMPQSPVTTTIVRWNGNSNDGNPWDGDKTGDCWGQGGCRNSARLRYASSPPSYRLQGGHQMTRMPTATTDTCRHRCVGLLTARMSSIRRGNNPRLSPTSYSQACACTL
jgi:hypothetical protein